MNTGSKQLAYLNEKPLTVYWQVVSPKGAHLTVLQDHDLIYDDYDCKIRKLGLTFDELRSKLKK